MWRLKELNEQGLSKYKMRYTPGAADAATDQNHCEVCKSQFKFHETIRTLPCMHVFHLLCIDQWLEGSELCPICRTR
jgi:E3 ubiquitin-protein ligase SDIR1